MTPPKGVIDQIHQILSKFFWGNYSGVKGKHWVAWSDMCYPKREGGIDFRSLVDISHALFAKGASQIWKKMMRIRDEVEHEIWWQQKKGTASLWMDNWTKQGALYFTEPQGLNEEVEVKEMILNEQWNTSRLRQLKSEDMVKCILDNINPRMKGEDKHGGWATHKENSLLNQHFK
ncbi:hypothetical protein H5410_053294 [Solanum commersonii]|uniref:Uncharacterized protein n=1 Tax=Solanum commersonii TaxID=4109 RepID=A0A9J5X3F7_SOLCO|nr:hypothetical protein H5410_053294 [Solanum commersonii]